MAPLIYGIAVAPKQGGDRVSEWFPTEAQRNEFLTWYRQHGRDCAPVEKVDAAAVELAERRKARDEHDRALEIARAGRSIISNSTRYDAGPGFYPSYVSGGGIGLALGVALGSLF